MSHKGLVELVINHIVRVSRATQYWIGSELIGGRHRIVD